ncbi:MAG: site-specific integrase, partial [Candidatus Marsarchaeota archaeon]|nr:site-specific integrase [Candidatus Marsarchaeota archaeon]
MATKARRGRSEGSIRKRADGRWEARVCLGYEAGKLKRRSFYGATRQEVQRKMARAIVDLQKGLQLPSELLTVNAFLDQWLAECVHPPAVKPSTYTSYEGHVRLHIKPAIGRVRLSRLSPEQVQKMVREKIDQGLSPKTVRHIVTTLRTALNQALKWGLVGRNVASLVTVPRIPRVQVNHLTADEVRTLFEAVRGDRCEALYILVVATGL